MHEAGVRIKTHVEEPRCYAVARSELFEGIGLVFLRRKNNDRQVETSGVKTHPDVHVNCVCVCVDIPFRSQSEARTDRQHHSLQPVR